MDALNSNALGRLYRDGEIIVRQGELGDCMYVVLEGKVEVSQRHGDQEYCLAVLQKGDLFGEIALFDQETRSATVRSLGGAVLLTVDKRTFVQRMHEDASFAYKILRSMARRIRDLEAKLIRVADVPINSAAGGTAKSAR